ncbi:IclR family transcriptional regulator [Streptomyces luteolus]|uniref:IclR family transcriptional regulator n=1 Tax=Streptomyces luteolus TaxID=3043615 RepID=A0ABT6SUV2_9ACTN|nr:IclR family transcriptional regulator [Streptomyces sp. B-S-A12]MDI3419180.1 IclR family transcriptional regulator [Streptomyces sp. B-S-A12]
MHVIRGVLLLRELARHESGATVTELAAAVGLARPTAFRLLNSFEQTGFVDRVDSKYTLGWEFARLARPADPYDGLASRIQPALDELARALGETVTLSVPTPSHELELIAAATGSQVVGVSVESLVGQHWPLHASSTGKIVLADMPVKRLQERLPDELEAFTPDTITDRKVLLKELQQVREQGYSVIDNELEEGLLSVSRPVRDSAGALVAILTVDAPRYRFGRDRIPATLQHMQQASEELKQLMWPGWESSESPESP